MPGLGTYAQISEFSTHISSNHVNAIVQDNDGYIWFATSNGLNRYNGTNYKIFHSTSTEGGLPYGNIMDLAIDKEGRIWYGSETGLGYYTDGMFHPSNDAIYNPVSRVLELDDSCIVAFGEKGLIKFHKDDPSTMVGYYSTSGMSWTVNSVVSENNDIWLAREVNDSSFICILDRNLEKKKEYFLGKGEHVYSISEILPYTIFLSTNNGLKCFDARDCNEMQNMFRTLKEAVGKSRVHFILPYKDNTILLGIAGRGLFVYDSISEGLERIIPQSTMKQPSYTCFVDKDYNIWLSDRTNMVRFISSQKSYSNIFSPSGGDSVDIRDIFFDNDGRLWALNNERIVCIDPSTGQLESTVESNDRFSFLYLDSYSRIWTIANHEMVKVFRIDGNGLTLLREFPFSYTVSSLAESRNRNIFIPEMFSMNTIHPDWSLGKESVGDSLSISQVRTDLDSRRSFAFTVADGLFEIDGNGRLTGIDGTKGENVSSVLVARDGTLWLGTYNKGILHIDLRNGRKEAFDKSSGLINDNIKSLIEDRNGNIWFSTTSHITRFDTRSRTFSFIHDDQYSNGVIYNMDCAAQGPDGKLYFGGNQGITIVDPEINIPQTSDIPLYLEYIAVNGNELQEGTPSLKLNHDQNTLQFRFAGLDFRAGSLQNYSYRLEGHETRWNYTSSNDLLATYSSLPAGKYTFHARVRNQNGSWSRNEIRLPIVIKPTIWASTFAKTMYFLLAIGLLAGIVWLLSRWRYHRAKSELDRHHIDMVANISHEFRTPLALIYGPLKELSKDSSLDEHEKGLVSIMKRNAERLKMLSEQILSTAASKPQGEKLNVAQGNLSDLVDSVVHNFRFAILEKGLGLETDIPEGIQGFFDGEKIEKILSNLLSNATKYTPSGGHIKVSLSEESGKASISVTDDGIGVPKDKREAIFARYERLGADVSKPGIPGTGIGLNYSKHLAVLEKGDLVYKPNTPSGSTFCFYLPIVEDAYTPDELNPESSFVIPEKASEENSRLVQDELVEKNGTLLIVEDNSDIRTYLGSLFNHNYQIMTASDGVEGLENLNIAVPDLIISDIMMPRKNGYQFCSDVKKSDDWSHIPVILLTAKADAQSSIEGLRCGAEAYIPKPFDPDYLVASVESMLANRRRLQERILNMTSTTFKEQTSEAQDQESEGSLLNEADKEFIEKMHRIIDEHIEEEQFNVNDITMEIGMSYSSLYAKVKTLTGKTPLDFINTYRMNIAMELIKSGKYTVNEVSYRIGASSPSNFSRNFKKHFGIAPSAAKD